MDSRPDLDDIIAEREVLFTHQDGSAENVMVRIGRPVIGDSPDLWHCPYQIAGSGWARTFAISGVDAMQALLLTLQVILPELDHIAQRENGKFSWLEDVNSGFPDYRLSPSYEGPK
jgi:hypothetical protein